MQAVVLLLLSLLPLAVRAEVLDKELSFGTVLACTVFGAAAAFFAARYRQWLLIVVLPSAVFLFGTHTCPSSLTPFVGRAMLAEARLTYVVDSWAAPVCILLSAVLGLRARNRAPHSA